MDADAINAVIQTLGDKHDAKCLADGIALMAGVMADKGIYRLSLGGLEICLSDRAVMPVSQDRPAKASERKVLSPAEELQRQMMGQGR